MPRTNWKLNTLEVSELVELREEVDRALGERIGREQSALQARLDELMALGGNARPGRRTAKRAAAVNGSSSRRTHALKGRKVAPKYRGPQGETWTGRGLAPRWLTELEGKGKKRDSFLIDR
jgi:DNA-binding protein H-NS